VTACREGDAPRTRSVPTRPSSVLYVNHIAAPAPTKLVTGGELAHPEAVGALIRSCRGRGRRACEPSDVPF
jgi:hypothetical protein